MRAKYRHKNNDETEDEGEAVLEEGRSGRGMIDGENSAGKRGAVWVRGDGRPRRCQANGETCNN